MIQTRFLVFIALFTLTSCESSESGHSPWVKPDSTVLGCEDYQSIKLENGVLYNNVWNKSADSSGKGSQCLEAREINGMTQYGWSWSWPKGKRAVYGYPQIKAGSSPWAPEPSVNDKFPARISELNTLRVSFDVETVTNGAHNLATSMWLINEPLRGNMPNPSVIEAEIMVWTYATKGHFNPAGKKLTEIQLDDTNWEIWVDRNWKDVSGANENRWVYITYRSTQSSLRSDIDLLKLLEDAVKRQLISSEHYVANIELGNEVMGGSGLTWVKSFNVALK